ncbi:unnamed protein product [Thelazia callipaeda]|uniref:WD_REPEATS_REGION domain-containing protein n=1 Tax=Thelazia callipaeda TaxID=103827 RepID=A0A0N5CXK5_THECL|nr:unnamed protein product [Thelazia callipaeda]
MDFRDREQTVLTSFDDARSITSIKALSFRPYSFITEDTYNPITGCLDGKTRAWSLLNGEKLCEFSSHQSRSVCSRPQIVYSPNWGGVPGNAAVLVYLKCFELLR